MGCCCCCPQTIAILAILAGLIYALFRKLTKPLPPPHLDVEEYWGPGDKSSYKEDTNIVSFDHLDLKQEAIDDLKKQLSRQITFVKPLEGVGFQYGFNTNKLQDIVKYWRDEYLNKWDTRVAYLKRYAHYKTQIQGLNIHFIHTKFETRPSNKMVFPVLLIHGWPGSVREFYEIIQKLVDASDNNYAFEVVVPSLPGYGWSQGSSKPGMGPAEVAVILRNLMIRLGYKKFFIQGGDWGSIIGSYIATLFPNNVIGYHSNFSAALGGIGFLKLFIASLFPTAFMKKECINFHFPIGKKIANTLLESGYMHIQATKPDTIGAALTANPIGLAAYILEKFSTWTNPEWRKLEDGGLEKQFTMDDLLDNIMIYYLTNSITTSQRIYAEHFSKRQRSYNFQRVLTTVPTGYARFKHDLFHEMDWSYKSRFTNCVHSTYHQDGGHFIAFENPNLLYKDFIEFVEKVLKNE